MSKFNYVDNQESDSLYSPSLSDRIREDNQNIPFNKLLALSSATMARRAIDYDLDTSILLTGARGVGKFIAATGVARQLSMHLLEVYSSLPVQSLLLKLHCRSIATILSEKMIPKRKERYVLELRRLGRALHVYLCFDTSMHYPRQHKPSIMAKVYPLSNPIHPANTFRRIHH